MRFWRVQFRALRAPAASVLRRGQRAAAPFPAPLFSAGGVLPPLRSGQVSLDEAEHFPAQSRSQRHYRSRSERLFLLVCAHIGYSRLSPRDGKNRPILCLRGVRSFWPSLRRIRSRHAAPETSDIEIERLPKRVRAELKGLAGTERLVSALCHDRSIRTFDSSGNAMWVGKWVGCFCARRL